MMGSLSLKKYETSGGGKLNCPVFCGSRSLCLSRSLLSLGKSHNVSVLKMKGLELRSFGTFSTQASVRLLGGSCVFFLFFPGKI